MLSVCWGNGGRLLISLLSQIHRFGEVTLEVVYLRKDIHVALFVSGHDLEVEPMDFELSS